MALRTEYNVRLATTLSKTVDFANPTQAIPYSVSKILETGTSAGQADLLWADQITLAASATQDIDLSGSLVDALGAAVVFAKVKAIVLVAAAANVNNVVLGAAASNQFAGPLGAVTHTVHVRPGGTLVLEDATTGWTVSAGTGDILRVANSGGTTGVTFDLFIIGTSA
jgi:hypothetical protein